MYVNRGVINLTESTIISLVLDTPDSDEIRRFLLSRGDEDAKNNERHAQNA